MFYQHFRPAKHRHWGNNDWGHIWGAGGPPGRATGRRHNVRSDTRLDVRLTPTAAYGAETP
jgi:hypothetical protein